MQTTLITADRLIERLNELRNDVSKAESYRLIADIITLIELASEVAEDRDDDEAQNRLYEYLA